MLKRFLKNVWRNVKATGSMFALYILFSMAFAWGTGMVVDMIV